MTANRPEPQTRLIAWLHLTDACNLSCAYCYVARGSEVMAPETGRLAVESVFRSAVSHRFSGVKLKYAGGEPILQFPRVADLHRQAQALAERYDLALSGVILSNGIGITSSMAQVMLALDLQVAISLDGLEEFHNRQRPMSSGQGSFEAVCHSIDLLLDHGLVPDIPVTVSGRNFAGLPLLVQWLLDRDLPFSMEFYRPTGSFVGDDGLMFEEDALIDTMRRVFQVIESNLPRRSLLARLLDRTNLRTPHLYPCAVGHNYLVIDCQGRIAKCQMDIQNTVTDILDPDPLRRIQEVRSGIQNLSVDEKEGCHDCQWRYGCAGGCPLVTYRATGCYHAKSPHCRIYQSLFPEAVRLEGLRLLKYAGKHRFDQPGVIW